LISILLTVTVIWCETAAGAPPQELPVVDGKRVVATVDGEPIFWAEFERALTLSHAEAFTDPKRKMAGELTVVGLDYTRILDRLVDIRLILLEAGNMGLGELPEVEEALAAQRRDTLRKMLLERRADSVRVEEEEVREPYRIEAREWKVKPALFKRKEPAEEVAARIAEGADFDEEIREAVSAGLATADAEGRYMKRSEASAPVAAVLPEMDVGQVSSVIAVGLRDFVLFQVQDLRDPETVDPKLWKEVRARVLGEKRAEAVRDYFRQLRERYATVDEDLLDSLDYEAESPGIESLQQDGRVLARIEGEEPITVSDLTAALQKKFFHGFERAATGKRVNSRKTGTLESLLENRILIKEALKQGLDRTDEYELRTREFENAVIFGIFIDKVIAPDIRIHPSELQAYYADHRDGFATPKMVRIQSLVFRDKDVAYEAVEKLSAGTDFEWFSANAEGLFTGSSPELLRFEGNLITQRSLPEDVREAIAGADTGDYRLYSDEQNGYYYVLRMKQVRAPEVQPLEAVREEIVPALYKEKIKEAIDEWTAQLSRHYPVKIYLTSPE
jgi:hypothetical protein